jgi:hypothetical protein
MLNLFNIFAAMANKLKDFDIINIKHLARESGIPYMKIRNCIAGKYNSLEEHEETKLYNVIQRDVEKATLALGFTFEGKRVKPKD